jgi:hypothetical protein
MTGGERGGEESSQTVRRNASARAEGGEATGLEETRTPGTHERAAQFGRKGGRRSRSFRYGRSTRTATKIRPARRGAFSNTILREGSVAEDTRKSYMPRRLAPDARRTPPQTKWAWPSLRSGHFFVLCFYFCFSFFLSFSYILRFLFFEKIQIWNVWSWKIFLKNCSDFRI